MWRYQPVWTEDKSGRCYSLCEVYFDEQGKLDGWTANPVMASLGDDIEDLTSGLTQMLVDAWRWEPVAFASLQPGMPFTRRISRGQAEAIAQLVNALNDGLNYAALVTDIGDALEAQGIEAGTAETRSGSVHESPVGGADAP